MVRLAFCCAAILAAVTSSPVAAGERLNRTIELLNDNRPAYGAFAFDMSLEQAMKISAANLDYVFIDMEHRPYDVERLRVFLLGMTNKRRIQEKGSLQMDVTPIVRLPTSNVTQTEVLAKQVLNMGAFGLMFPTTSTAEQALQAVRVSRYPQARNAADMEPTGLRGFEPFHPGMWYWGLGQADYYSLADVWPLDPNGEILVVIQIENREGVANIDEILSVPGIGAVMIGSFDLSTSLGVVGEVTVPDVLAAVDKVVSACVARGIPVGSTGPGLERKIMSGELLIAVGSNGIRPEERLRLEALRPAVKNR